MIVLPLFKDAVVTIKNVLISIFLFLEKKATDLFQVSHSTGQNMEPFLSFFLSFLF